MRAGGDDPRLINRAAARLQVEGTIAVDLARLTSLDHPLRLAPHIEVKGTGRMNAVHFSPMPRLQSRRLRQATESAYSELRETPDEPKVKQIVAALRWLSLATTRWNESPQMAASLLYIALEAAHGGCIVSHRGNCKGDQYHETAVDRYIRSLPTQLADEVEAYMLRLRGSTQGARDSSGRSSSYTWMSKVRLNRRDQPIGPWAKRIMKAMAGAESYDPLLRFHLAELVKLHRGRLTRIREDCIDDLRELRDARNELVHATELVLSEQRTTYLASLAIEMLLLRIEAGRNC
jgi:hypothetical protein